MTPALSECCMLMMNGTHIKQGPGRPAQGDIYGGVGRWRRKLIRNGGMHKVAIFDSVERDGIGILKEESKITDKKK